MVKWRLMLRTIPSGLTSGILENKLLAKRASHQPSEMVSVEQFVVRNLKGLWLDPPGLWLKRIGTAPWCANVPCKLIALILDRPTWMQLRRYGQCDMLLAFRERARTCIRDRSRCIFRSIDMCLRPKVYISCRLDFLVEHLTLHRTTILATFEGPRSSR